MGVRGAPTDFYVKSKFRVEIDGIIYAGFRDCSPIGWDIEPVAHREGGANTEFNKPGNESYPPVTLTAGLSDMRNEMQDWADDGRAGGKDKSVNRAQLIRTVTVVQTDEAGNDVYTWTLYEAWPMTYRVEGFDKNANEVTIKTLILKYRYFDEESLVS